MIHSLRHTKTLSGAVFYYIWLHPKSRENITGNITKHKET